MVGIFELEPDDDPAAIDMLDIELVTDEPKMVTLRDPVTGDEQLVDAGLENVILILKSVGYKEIVNNNSGDQ